MTSPTLTPASPVMHLGPLAIIGMAVLYRSESVFLTVSVLGLYAAVAFMPMVLDAMSADMTGSKPDRTPEQRRNITSVGLAGIAAIVLSESFGSPVVTLGLCLLFTVATLGTVFCSHIGEGTGNAPVGTDEPDYRHDFNVDPDSGVPAPVPASSHHGLAQARHGRNGH